MVENQTEKTKMTAPPTGQTQMVSAQGAVKMERCRTLHPIWLGRESRIVPPGTEMDLTEEEVREFCDKVFRGPMKGEGEVGKVRYQAARRAIRMTDVAKIEEYNRFQQQSQTQLEGMEG